MSTATATIPDRTWNGTWPGPNPNPPPVYPPGPEGAPPRPTVLYRVRFEHAIPYELTALPNWVVWRFGIRGGKWTKVPFQPKAPSRKALAGVPETWGAFNKALDAFRQRSNALDGIGFEFPNERIYTGVDFDKCLSPDGQILDWAMELIAILGPTYLEFSPSGTGLKAIIRGRLPEIGKTGTKVGGFGEDGKGAVEMYDRGRFFTITGDVFGLSAGGDS